MSFASLEERRPQGVMMPVSEQLKLLFTQLRTYLHSAEQQLPVISHLEKPERTRTYALVKAANTAAAKIQQLLKGMKDGERGGARERWKGELEREMGRIKRLGNVFYRTEQQLSDSSSEEGGEKDAFLSEQIQQQSDTFEIQLHSDILVERDHKISHISSAIQEVNSLFKEISLMVNDQGESLDRIEDHLDSTAFQTKRTVEELERAEEKGKDNKQRQCCLVLLAVLVLLVVSLLSAVTWKKSR